MAPSITLDLRDDPANPTRGVVASGTAELTSSLLADYQLQGMKAQGFVTGYLPLARRVVLAGSLRAGRFVPLGPSKPLPVPKRFFLGVGTGESLKEVPANGMAWPALKERSARLRESV